MRFPKKDTSGKVTRDRYHLDYLIQIGPVLILQELKGTASESGDDIAKLRGFMRSYDLAGIRQIMSRRVHDVEALAELRYVVPSLGYEICDAELPVDFIGIRAWEGGVDVSIGEDIDRAVATIISETLTGRGDHTA